MDTELRKGMERVVLSVVHARRTLQLYPATNSLVGEAREAMHQAVAQYSERLKQSGAQRVCCEIRRDGFYVDESPLGAERAAVQRLARQLYLGGAKLWWFTPDAGNAQADAFVAASLQLEADDSAAVWSQLEQGAFGVERLREAAVDSGAFPPALDLVEYLATKHRSACASDNPEQTSEHGLSNHRQLAELLEFFHAVERGNELEHGVLMSTLTESGRIAEALTAIARMPGAGQQKESAAALTQTLRHIRKILEELPESERGYLMANIAEAILRTDPATMKSMTSDVLAAELGGSWMEDEIVRRLPPRVRTSVLMDHVNFHDGTAGSVVGFLDSLPDDFQRGQTVQILNEEITSHATGGEAEGIATQIRLTQDGGCATQMSEEPLEAARIRAAKLRELTGGAMRVTREEAMVLREAVRSTNEQLDQEQDAFTLFLLASTGQLELDNARVLARLREALNGALHQGHFDLLSRVIEFALGTARDDVLPDTFCKLSAELTPLYSDRQFGEFVHRLAQHRQEDSGLAPHTLDAIAQGAAPVLLDSLEREQARRRRFTLLSLLADLGSAITPQLVARLGNSPWFVARNAVYLLGRIGGEQNLACLVRALQHEDARVRAEVIEALEHLAVDGIEIHLSSALSDSDPRVRGNAAAALARRGDRSHLNEFVGELRSHMWRLRGKPEHALRLINAIGLLADAQAVPVLRRFRRWCSLPGTRRRAELRAACDRAMAEIAVRHAETAAMPVSAGEDDGNA